MTFDRFESDAAERDRAYTAMLANISDVIAVFDRDGINRFKSANVRDIFGWAPEDLVGHHTLDNVHPDDRGAMQEIINRLLQISDSVSTGECRYQHADGNYRWIRFTAANKLEDSVLQGILLNYRDITEERRGRERFRTTFEAAPVGMILADDSNRIIEANRAAERLLEYGSGELTGMNGRHIIHPDDLGGAPIETVTQQILQEPEPLEIENRFRTKSGEYIDVYVKVGRIELEDRSASHIVQFYDITRRKRAEQRVRMLLEEKELLLKEVHHRIKNDLNLVQSLLSTQARTLKGDAAAALRDAGNRVGVMARVYERFQGANGLDDVSLPVVIGGLVGDLRAGLLPTDVTLRTDVEEVSLSARLSVSLGIIINELITNAVKHSSSDAGLEISITVRREKSDRLRLTVRDTGPGFPPEVLSGERSGYGLTIASALVAQHEGTMVLGNAGGGTVEIQIPTAIGPSSQR